MSGARRFPPSQRRREEARRRGDVAVSPVLVGWVALLAAVLSVGLTGPAIAGRLSAFTRRSIAAGFGRDPVPAALLDESVGLLIGCLGPVLLAAWAAAVAAGVVQTRGLLTLAPLAPDLRRRPADGALRALALAVIAAAATALALRMEGDLALRAAAAPGAWVLGATLEALARVALRVGLVMVAAGGVDLLMRYQRRERGLLMTRGEVERERRDEEGDPRLAAERRRRHMALAGPSLVDQVAASLLIVAAEGVAAGIRSDGQKLIVAAAGERLVAARILDLARRFGVPVRYDATLAPHLAALTPGDPVPPPLAPRGRAHLAAAP